MKFFFCISAFVIGCLTTVYFSADAQSAKQQEQVAVPTTDQDENKKPELKVSALDINKKSFGATADGKEVTHYTLTNSNGLILEMIDYGATVTSLQVPDRTGKLDNITLGCSGIEGYEACTSYFGCTVGRYCNRIAGGKFNIGDLEYTLAKNNGNNHLHGGKTGFDKQIWNTIEIRGGNYVGLRFELQSQDGEEGYPGNLKVAAEYLLTNDDELIVEFTATTDKETPVNLTNHCYWNLAGAGSGSILDHELKLESKSYVPVNAEGIPTGELAKVEGTPFDFREFNAIGKRVKDVKAEPTGYDHCFALNGQSGELSMAASIRDPKSGRLLDILTTQPGIQFYTGNFLDGQPGSGGFDQHTAFCLETQHYPDSPNQANFPRTILKPGEMYRQKTVHRFSIIPSN